MSKRKTDSTRPDKENPTWSPADFAKAQRVEDIPALAHLSKRKPGQRGPQKAPTKVPVTIRLDANVVDAYKATGEGWQSRMNDALGIAAKHLKR
jgi:uncharacterized protein (DUF4415 family)